VAGGGDSTTSRPQIHVLDFGLAWLRQDALDARLDGNKPMSSRPRRCRNARYMAPSRFQHEMHPTCAVRRIWLFARLHFVPLYRSGAPLLGESKELLRVHALSNRPPALKAVIDAPEAPSRSSCGCSPSVPWGTVGSLPPSADAEWGKWRPKASFRVSLPVDLRSFTAKTAAPRGRPARAVRIRICHRRRERAPGLLSIRPARWSGARTCATRCAKFCDDVIDGVARGTRVMFFGPRPVAARPQSPKWLCEVVQRRGTMVPLRRALP